MSSDDYRIQPEPRTDGLRRIVGYSFPDNPARLLARCEEHRVQAGYATGRILSEARHALEALVIGEPRPCDAYLDDWPLYTDFRARPLTGSLRHVRRNRLVVDATLTKADNLSVRIRPQYLSENGYWSTAPEWRLPYLGGSAIMERPDDEILFVRGTADLAHERLSWTLRGREVSAEERREIDLACQVTSAAFWLAVWRLSLRFDVKVGHYLALLAPDERGGAAVGLEILDGLGEHRGRLASRLASFEADSGYAPGGFWAPYEDALANRHPYAAAEAVSRKLRTRSGPASGLTPGAVRGFRQVLEQALRYGLWTPVADASAPPAGMADAGGCSRGDPGPETPFPEPDEVAAPYPLAGRMRAAGGGSRTCEAQQDEPAGAPDAKSPMVRRPRRPKPAVGHVAVREGTVARTARPAYPARATALGEEVKAEFGVETAHELVTLLNAAWSKVGRRPLPQGSYPTNRPNLAHVLRELRLARANGTL